MDKIIRFLLFFLPAEFAHSLALKGLKFLYWLKLSWLVGSKADSKPVELLGLRFDNPVGLAAGLDKNGDYIDALGALGFGFLEIGTITPRPQPGNPKPRLFRLPEYQAIINRMGFNNKGVDHLVERLKKRRYQGIVGVNIGKNLSTPVDAATQDYLICLRSVYEYADYVVINLSSPNTPGLRNLQFGAYLDSLLASLKQEQGELEERHHRHVPLLVKIAPDLTSDEIASIAATLLRQDIEGVIATNTTISREAVKASRHAAQSGGLSGAPLGPASNQVIRELTAILQGRIPVIGVGGIVDGDSAAEKARAGASLVQIYSGFIYRGPALIKTASRALNSLHKPP